MSALDALRGTGRTTRMLEEANRMKREGARFVCVVMSTKRECDMILPLLEDGVLLVTPLNLEWDWDTMRVRGYSRSMEYLIDHHVIEKRYARILLELHRFDPEGMKERMADLCFTELNKR